MPVPRPTSSALQAAAEHHGFRLGPDDLASYAALIDATLGSYDVVNDLYPAATSPIRKHWAPSAEENELGAWARRCDVPPEASGVLDGHTVAVKDNIAVAGVPMVNGSASLQGFVPTVDATAVTRVLGAGARIAGKSVCEDLCFSGSSFTAVSGPVRNPWDPSRSAGGSSSGSAALVVSGAVDLALGGDQGGSIRIPASFSGAVGHKPTYGLVPYTGAFPIERTLDHLGPIAWSVSDAALLLTVLAGPDGADPSQPVRPPAVANYSELLDVPADGLRIGLVREGFGHESSMNGVDDLVRSVARAVDGAVAEEVSIPWHRLAFHLWNVIATDGGAYQMLDGNGYGLNSSGRYDPDLMELFARQRIERADELSDTVKLVAMCGHHGVRTLGGANYAKARNLVPAARAAYDEALNKYDVLVMPTVPFTASLLATPDDTRVEVIDKALGMIANTAPFNVTGHPAISVPAGFVDGLPVGLMIVGRHFADDLVLRVARQIEIVRGPDTSAVVRRH